MPRHPAKDSLERSPLFRKALSAHRAGNIAGARNTYRQLLSQFPDHADLLFLAGSAECQAGNASLGADLLARHLQINPGNAAAHSNRGLALQSLGRPEEALAAYRKAIDLEPDLGEAHYNLGNALRNLRRLAEALASFDTAIGLKPDHAAAYFNRGHALRDLGRLDEALASYGCAIELKPDWVEVHFRRGVLLDRLKRFDEALASYGTAIDLKPGVAEGHYNRGNTLRELARFAEAVASFDKAVELKPTWAEAHFRRGIALESLKRFDEALASFDKAIDLRPDYAAAHSNRGLVLQSLGRLEEALASYGTAIDLNPGSAETHFNRGNALRDLGRFDDALASYDTAIGQRDHFAEAHLSRGLCRLQLGDFQNGLKDYEWRMPKDWPADRVFRPPRLPSTRDLPGRTVLVCSEQGLGDTIQFCRYVDVLRAQGATVVFATQKKLHALVGSLPAKIVDLDDRSSTYDYVLSLMSLPLLFGTTLESMPRAVPYLVANADRVDRWQSRLGERGFKIGICWQGSTTYKLDHRRSFPVNHFSRLSGLRGVRLISLHKGDGEDQLKSLPQGMVVENLGSDFDGGPDAFADTSAVMKCLDLVITSDTAIAHLAGALGVPTWVVLGRLPDWRWLLDRDDSPWYPTMRLFRQNADAGWEGVFEEIAAALEARVTAEPPLRAV